MLCSINFCNYLRIGKSKLLFDASTIQIQYMLPSIGQQLIISDIKRYIIKISTHVFVQSVKFYASPTTRTLNPPPHSGAGEQWVVVEWSPLHSLNVQFWGTPYLDLKLRKENCVCGVERENLIFSGGGGVKKAFHQLT